MSLHSEPRAGPGPQAPPPSDTDHQIAAYAALPPEIREHRSRDEWLRDQEARRRYEFDQQLAYTARRNALARERLAEAAVHTAKIRALQCPACFLVRTPAGTCNCTEG